MSNFSSQQQITSHQPNLMRGPPYELMDPIENPPFSYVQSELRARMDIAISPNSLLSDLGWKYTQRKEELAQLEELKTLSQPPTPANSQATEMMMSPPWRDSLDQESLLLQTHQKFTTAVSTTQNPANALHRSALSPAPSAAISQPPASPPTSRSPSDPPAKRAAERFLAVILGMGHVNGLCDGDNGRRGAISGPSEGYEESGGGGGSENGVAR